MSGSIRIGTSGFHHQHRQGRFYPPKTPASRMLDFYLQHFDTQTGKTLPPAELSGRFTTLNQQLQTA